MQLIKFIFQGKGGNTNGSKEVEESENIDGGDLMAEENDNFLHLKGSTFFCKTGDNLITLFTQFEWATLEFFHDFSCMQ